ncbi:F-box domain cyclin-like protein [Botryosphaeria dothidea]|uniref:F-box domain cyclin-like protein n=1 Tax=Botryosphaeria dothidea TaxID=55169 RepID=A0A8H4IZB7_9PEZI|nr:F-box domain cyclin-like protein [Botryosphaeria dothidea]
MPGANLYDLPAEIIDDIALQVQPIECASLRLVCKELATKSIYAFKNVCFRTRRHMLSEYSLRGLLELSRNHNFGPAVTTLMIGTEQYEEKYADPMLNNSLAALSSEERDTHAAEVRQQKRRRDAGVDALMLAEALKNMPNCRSIEIVGNHIPASTAYQHYSASEELVYHSWGARTMADRIGIFPPTVSGREKGVTGFASHVFVTVLAALAISGSSSISSLTTRVRYFQGISCTALHVSHAHFPGLASAFRQHFSDVPADQLEDLSRERIRRAVSSLNSLVITFDALAVVRPAPTADAPTVSTFPSASAFDTALESHRCFLAMLPPTLARLRISAGYDIADGFLFRVFADTAWFASVEILSLNDCKCQRWDVPRAILAACPRLRRLSLAAVSAPENYFPAFLRCAVGHGALELLRVSYLMEQAGWVGVDPSGPGVDGVDGGVQLDAVSPFVEKVRTPDASFRVLECHGDCEEELCEHVSWAVAGTPGWDATNVFQLRGRYDGAAGRGLDRDLIDP